MGLITNNERYNQIIDVWTNINTKLTKVVIDTLVKDQDGFNPVYMMLDSGARGSKEQIRQLSGMRGLMAKPQKSGVEGGQQVIENPILSNFKEGLSVLEYFVSTHGARKGLADTALKTADAGYLTRRLVDVAQDVIITEEDCGTLRGLTATAIKRNDDVVQTLYDRILGRTAVQRRDPPAHGRGDRARRVRRSPRIIAEAIDEVAAGVGRDPFGAYLRGASTASARSATAATWPPARMVQKGEVVGVIAAQSIGEPGTQLTLRTFHVGGVAGGVGRPTTNVVSTIRRPYRRSRSCASIKGKNATRARRRTSSSRRPVGDPHRRSQSTEHRALYASRCLTAATLFMTDGAEVKKGDLICEWDPYNAVIISEYDGKVAYENVIEGVTYREERDEQTGLSARSVIIESKDKTKNPVIRIHEPGRARR